MSGTSQYAAPTLRVCCIFLNLAENPTEGLDGLSANNDIAVVNNKCWYTGNSEFKSQTLRLLQPFFVLIFINMALKTSTIFI